MAGRLEFQAKAGRLEFEGRMVGRLDVKVGRTAGRLEGWKAGIGNGWRRDGGKFKATRMERWTSTI
jgi:hypothetical protein